jgi:hypothetical protein
MRNDSFNLLLERHGQLVRAGQGSLQAAYNFGEVVNVMHDQGYSYAALGDMVALSGPGISTYAKLFRKYPTVNTLLRTSEQMGTYDVSRLASDGETAHYSYLYHCSNCGSFNVKRERAPEVPASAEVEAHTEQAAQA